MFSDPRFAVLEGDITQHRAVGLNFSEPEAYATIFCVRR
jgi:hypothetical protein